MPITQSFVRPPGPCSSTNLSYTGAFQFDGPTIGQAGPASSGNPTALYAVEYNLRHASHPCIIHALFQPCVLSPTAYITKNPGEANYILVNGLLLARLGSANVFPRIDPFSVVAWNCRSLFTPPSPTSCSSAQFHASLCHSHTFVAITETHSTIEVFSQLATPLPHTHTHFCGHLDRNTGGTLLSVANSFLLSCGAYGACVLDAQSRLLHFWSARLTSLFCISTPTLVSLLAF